MRIVFMGSPEFAVSSLDGLVSAGHQLALVVSQPDRPAGRGRQMRRPPVVVRASELNLPLHQPTNLRVDPERAPIAAATPDVIVVAAFGLILPPEVLAIPALGSLNVHASLLPRYRGASPIQAAILAGDAETGVTIMLMDQSMDTGPILSQRSTPIGEREDAPGLERRLAALGRDLLLETLEPWSEGRLHQTPQDDALASYAPSIRREQAALRWEEPAVVSARRVRAFRGWPRAYTYWAGRQISVLEAQVIAGSEEAGVPGGVVRSPVDSHFPAVITGDGLLHLDVLQLEGRRPVTGPEFLRGHADFLDARLGASEVT